MNHKYFSLITLIGALVLFSIVPIINYKSDMTRILHHDYKHVYQGVNPNKLFLKSIYLKDHLDKYDTLVYGSSRGGFMDVSLISDRAYNMDHGFGTIATYLDNLKTMIESGMKIKEVWIGINDFDIWKNQTTKKGLVHMAYHNGIFGNATLYSDWLFTTRERNIKIAKGEIPLVETPYITNTKAHVDRARLDAKKLPKNRYIPPTTLGYTGIFRIDDVIKELKELKEVCQRNHIKLISFFYPTFYKTYLRYNQFKIEEFKRKMTSVIDFYDFYDIGEISIDQKNWLEGSHFMPHIGDFIIKSITNHTALLVNNKNIEERIQTTRNYIHNITKLSLLPKGKFAYHYNPHIDFSTFPIIFDIKDNNYTKNNQFILTQKDTYVEAKVTQPDPIIILNKIKTNAKYIVLTGEITCEENVLLQLFYKKNKKSIYTEAHSYPYKLKKGYNAFRIIIDAKYIHNDFRIDFTNKVGIYQIKKLNIRELSTL